ncbi:MAG: YqhA family protein [Ilumatobacteraceae bacterium]|jgi:uncharacterized membrane protein YqhA
MRFLLERFRFIAVIAVIGLAVTAAATFGWSVAKSVKFVSDLLSGEWRNELMVVKLLQVIDTYLLAIVQVIIALGIYELFVSDLDVPSWLDVHSLDDLKKPIIDVLVVYVGVKGVEALVKTPDSADALRSTAAVGIIILALTGFRLAKSAGKKGRSSD